MIRGVDTMHMCAVGGRVRGARGRFDFIPPRARAHAGDTPTANRRHRKQTCRDTHTQTHARGPVTVIGVHGLRHKCKRNRRCGTHSTYSSGHKREETLHEQSHYPHGAKRAKLLRWPEAAGWLSAATEAGRASSSARGAKPCCGGRVSALAKRCTRSLMPPKAPPTAWLRGPIAPAACAPPWPAEAWGALPWGALPWGARPEEGEVFGRVETRHSPG